MNEYVYVPAHMYIRNTKNGPQQIYNNTEPIPSTHNTGDTGKAMHMHEVIP